MSQRVRVPTVLKSGPFTLREAELAGLTWDHLQSTSYQHLAHGTYAWVGLRADSLLMLQATLHRLPRETVFSGRTAPYLHGLDVPLCDPIHVTLPRDCGVSSRSGVRVRRSELKPEEVVRRHGLPCTSILRTLLDIGESPSLVENVVIADMALHADLISKQHLQAVVGARAGTKFAKRLRQMVDLAEPGSESAMETRLRIMLVQAGLPRPELQVNLQDDNGQFLGRADLYYPSHRLVIEYDGATHRTTLVEDNRRQNRILGAGHRLLRFTAADLRDAASVVAQVRAVLAAAPHPG
jgi:very-short-patch-repair endonuclease